MMPFEFFETSLPGVLSVQPRVFPDDRGFFLETYKKSDFAAAGITEDFEQDNHSFSQRTVLRGIHFQRAPHAQGKLVRAIEGKVWDLAVDIRPQSPNFRQWVGVELDSKKGNMLYIPPGFGHAFVVLSETAHFCYKCTAEYAPSADGGIRWNDPDLAIEWPVTDPIVSEKDVSLPFLKDTVYNL
jgi:dTDP-4-dehydrorhamnose 3,5-epimerase